MNQTNVLFFVEKDVAIVNGINIGRYWPSVGPQITLYIPALFWITYPGLNNIIMLELEGVSENLSISLVDNSNLNGIQRGFWMSKYIII